MKGKPLILAASISGIIVGVLSAAPIVYVLNFVFFGWIWIGAAFATFLYRHWALSLKPSQGAVIGLLTGVFAAPVTLALSYIFGRVIFGNDGCFLAAGSALTFFYVLPFPFVGALAGALAGVFFEQRMDAVP
jgi:hypothetical protein